MTNSIEESVLDLRLRRLLDSLENKDASHTVSAPGREHRKIGVNDMITVTVVCEPGKHQSVIDKMTKEGFDSSGDKGIMSVTMPVRFLREVEKIDGIKSVQASVEVFLPRLNFARSEANLPENASQLMNIGHPNPLTGKNVVVATIDSGLDWEHKDFRDYDDNTRVAYYAYWDDDVIPSSTAKEPKYVHRAGHINKALKGELNIPFRDPGGHGTHCMSIAAGNGRASDHVFRGVAPEATIMALGTPVYLPVITQKGIEVFFKEAEKLGQPAVISLSYGLHYGSHDGTSQVEEVIKRHTGKGRIVVVCAGNEAEDGIHWQGKLRKGEDAVIPIRIGDDSYQWVDIWINGVSWIYKADRRRQFALDVWLENPDRVQYNHTLPDRMETEFGEISLGVGVENGNTRITLEIRDGRLNDLWRIRITESADVDARQIHAWSGTDEPKTSSHLFSSTLVNDYTVGIPATVEEAIVVGSFISNPGPKPRNKYIQNKLPVRQLSPFSSHGPTRVELQKPDIVAPGQFVTAALASESKLATAERYRSKRRKSGKYIELKGTSMSAPFVAGVVALMLERCNDLTPKDVRELLTLSAKTPEGQGKGQWHPGFGYGMLDTEELFKRLECR